MKVCDWTMEKNRRNNDALSSLFFSLLSLFLSFLRLLSLFLPSLFLLLLEMFLFFEFVAFCPSVSILLVAVNADC
jgi:hypothetical protein